MTGVVCIEDNPVNQVLLRRLLARRPGLEFVVVGSGAEGIAEVRERGPVLVICDLHLPDLDGDEVIRQLRAEPGTADVPVAVVSADATESARASVMALGADAYLTKPFDIKEFYLLLDRYL